MLIPFSKYCGAGNDFILIDNRNEGFPKQQEQCSSLVRNLSHRTRGIGADGVVFLQNSSFADFGMRIFNCDGSEAEMCGNGLRCLGKFLNELGYTKNSYTIETPLALQKCHHLELSEQNVRIAMELPQKCHSIFLPEHGITVESLDTGVPHAVHFVDNIESIDVFNLGASIRYHPAFFPKGTNVNFAKLTEKGIIVRTYERGVEKETSACGTGGVATAFAAVKKFALRPPISLFVRSKDTLEVDFEWNEKENLLKIFLSGPASHTFRGNFQLEDFLSPE